MDRKDDLSPLTDINWVAANLELMATSSSASPPSRTRVPASWPPGSRPSPAEISLAPLTLDEEQKTKWKGEGVVLEILELP